MGLILQNTADYNMVRDQLRANSVAEAPDTVITEAWALGSAESFVMARVPNWQLILSLAAPVAAGLSASGAGSNLPAATYYVKLVAKAGGTSSLPGPEASVVVAAGQLLNVTAPSSPGVTSYDVYVGVGTGAEFFQINVAPASTTALSAFTMLSTPVAQAAQQNDVINLKAGVAAAVCAALCRRMWRVQPAERKTLTFMERVDVDWRQEEGEYLYNVSAYLGLISTYQITPAPAAMGAHPMARPTDPEYISGTDPDAVPSLFPFPHS
jgi:hypothetical protein